MTPLQAYEKAADNLAREFVEKYYGEASDFDSPDHCWWIADHKGGALIVNDEYWSMDIIVEAMRIDAPLEKLFNWYHHRDMHKYNLTYYCKLL